MPGVADGCGRRSGLGLKLLERKRSIRQAAEVVSIDFVKLQQASLLGTLRKCQMFSDLPENLLQGLVEVCVLKTLRKGEWLFHEGQPADGFYVVHSGAINVHRISDEGKEQVLRVFYPGESFAEICVSTLETYPAEAVALEDSQVILLQRGPFRELIRREPDFALRILASMSLHLKYLVQMIEDLKFKQAEARLANWLLRSDAADKGTFELPTTKRLLASQLGLASETLSRLFARLREKGVITVDGARITIHDRDFLHGLIEGQ